MDDVHCRDCAALEKRAARTPRRVAEPRHPRVDLFIAATAIAAGLPLYTRNPSDFAGLSHLLEIVVV